MIISESKDINALPVGTIARVSNKYSASDWVKTSGSTWAALGFNYTAEQAADYVARRVNNVSPQNAGEHEILNPEAVIFGLIRKVQDAKLSSEQQSRAASRAQYRLHQIEEFINGDHDCEASA